MVVQRGDLDPALFHFGHDRVHFVLRQDQIAHHHRVITQRLKCDPPAERQARFDRDPVERYLELGSREANPIDTAALHGARFA